MNPIQQLVLGLLVIPSISMAGDQPWKMAEELLIHNREELKFEKSSDVNASHGFLASVSFTETTSSPRSVIIEGFVKHSNNHAPLERVPIYIGADKDSVPMLAGMTNCDGNFKFRLWIKEDQRTHQIQTSPNFEGYLYVMGSFEKSDFPFGSYTQRYSLEELHRRFKKEAEQAGTGQPATRPESKSEGSDKPQPEAEGRSR
jgi:hypothetical protein